MITQLQLNYEIAETMNAFTIEDCPLPNTGDKVKVYIPKFMSKIGKASKPENEIVPLQSSNMLFINDSSCRPSVSSSIKTQNYIEAIVTNESSWNNNSIIYKTDDTGKHNYLKKNTKGICECPNNLLKTIYFSDNIRSNEVFKTNESPELNGGNGIKVDDGKISLSGRVTGKIISQEDDNIVIDFE